ncbi:energy transducer TonB [Photobacterium gaetbulicola]|uniref:Protein TonB n=1 Tax=Photobacterium gaetbulicola Gung47 TaxID=658445 RepID=A0A0C5X0V9_9GAMM|nr:energy transducer TonB [Photobacterium gaetbulicola]AJR08960.1 TonB protein [Photobacterium gaetbulicola Gung47]PSU13516.1 energy transducer TonB [Photobacterium gaetbulicola]
MNAKRYAIAGVVSVLAHSLLLSAVPNKMVMAMPVGTDSTKVSLNLIAAPTPQQAEPVTSEPLSPASVEAPQKVVKEKTAVKKLVKKKQPEPKAQPEEINQPVPEKPVEKNVEQKIAKKPTPVQKPVEVNRPKPVEDKVKTPAPTPPAADQAASGVNSEPQLITKPTFATRPSPVTYPRIAKRRGIEGQVLVEIWIDESGKQVKQNLLRSSGAEILDEAALEAIKRWRFSSHIVDGQAIAHRVQVPVRFKLD